MRTYTDSQMILSGDCVSSISVLWSLCYVNTQGEKLFMFLYSGNIGTELSSTNLGMFITSDAGNSWRQVRTIQVYTLPVCLLWTEDVFMLKVCCQKWSKWVFLFFFFSQWRFLMKSTTFGSLTMEGLYWQSYTQRHQFDTYGRCSGSSTIADVTIIGGRNSRYWSCGGKLLGYHFIVCVRVCWGYSMQHMITFNVFEMLMGQVCMIIVSALQLQNRAWIISNRRDSVIALYSWLDMMVWVLLCKWEVEQGGNMRLRMPS